MMCDFFLMPITTHAHPQDLRILLCQHACVFWALAMHQCAFSCSLMLKSNCSRSHAHAFAHRQISLFGFPYGSYKATLPFSYETEISSGNFTMKKPSIDTILEPMFAVIPPSLLIKSINDYGALSASDKDVGMRFADR
jgi:hypothetical protein